MRPIYHAELINPIFGDPGLYVDLKFERRALLFDIGDVTRLSTRKLLRISDVFVSHTHMDHFSGFDHLLRVCLGRDAGVRIYGPAPFIDRVEHKLAAYTWNLVDRYETDFVVTAHELFPDGRMARAQFRSQRRFLREALDDVQSVDGALCDDAQFKVRCAQLDHCGIVSLAFAFEEGTHINVWKNRLEELRLPTGPWLTTLKQRVREGAPDDTPICVHWRDRGGSHERTFSLGDLRERVLEFVPGEKVCYVTDVAWHEQNASKLHRLVDHTDLLFIESVFLEEDIDHARRKGHLTATQAGMLARTAHAKHAVPFHFSPRYLDREHDVRAEFECAYGKSG